MLRILSVACALVVCASFGDPEPKPAHVTGIVTGPDLLPIPEYTLELYTTRPDPAQKGAMRDRLERVTTDAEGKFTSALTYTPGPLRFVRIDRDGTELVPAAGDLESIELPQRTYNRDHDGKPVKLAVACGPTFELAWQEHVHAEGEDPLGPAIGAAVARLYATNGIDDGWSYTTTVRATDDKHGWVRFGGWPKQASDTKPGRLMLEVFTSDGQWKSLADVTDLAQAKSKKLDLVWKPACRLVAQLDGVKPTDTERIWLYAERLDEKGTVLERRRRHVEPDGGVMYRGLDAGTWRLTATALRYRPWTGEPIALKHASPVKTKVDLKPCEKGTSFVCFATGDPVVEGGREPRPGRAWIARDDGVGIPKGMIPLDEQPLVWKQHEGEWRAEVAFADILPGAYSFAIVALDSEVAPNPRMSGIMNSVTGGPIPGVSWRWPESPR